jgi:hypothetical protein
MVFFVLEPPIEMKKIDTLKVDTLNVIDIMSLTDEESEREIHQIDINQEIVIPKIEPLSLFSDDDDNDDDIDSEGNKKCNKLNRQRTSLNQSKIKDSDILLMETSLTIIDQAPLSPPPFSPPPPMPLSPNTKIVTTSFNREVGFLSLPLTSTTTESMPQTSESRKHHHRHRHHHKHRHSTAVGRTAPIDDRGSNFKSNNQQPETEIVLSPSKLGQ